MSDKKSTNGIKLDGLNLEHISNLDYIFERLNRYWVQAQNGDFKDIADDISLLAIRGVEEANIIIKNMNDHAPHVMKLLGKEFMTFMHDTLKSCSEVCKEISDAGGVISKAIGSTLKGLFEGLQNLIKFISDKVNEITASSKHDLKGE